MVRVRAERLTQCNGNVAAGLFFYEGRDFIRIDFAVYGILNHRTADELNVHLRATNEIENQADDHQANRDAEQNFSVLIEIKIKLFHYLSAPPNSHFLRDRNEKIGRKIRDNELKRVPYLLIVGEKEEAEGLVSVRAQGEGDKGQMTMEAFRDLIAGLVKEEIDANKLEKK